MTHNMCVMKDASRVHLAESSALMEVPVVLPMTGIKYSCCVSSGRRRW